MSFAFLSVSVLLLVACLRWFGVAPEVRRVVAITRGATATMASTTLTEEQKEAAVRRATVEAFGGLCSITLRVALTLAMPALFVAAGVALGLYGAREAVAAVSDWRFVAGSSVIMVVAVAIIR